MDVKLIMMMMMNIINTKFKGASFLSSMKKAEKTAAEDNGDEIW